MYKEDDISNKGVRSEGRIKRLYEAEMDVVADIVGMVKTNANVFCKDKIENLTDWFQTTLYTRVLPHIYLGRIRRGTSHVRNCGDFLGLPKSGANT